MRTVPPGAHQAVKLLHGGHDVGHMLDHVDGQQAVEGVVAKGIGQAVEVAEDIGAAGGIAIDADGARLLMNAAADIEDSVGHPSRVSKREDPPGIGT